MATQDLLSLVTERSPLDLVRGLPELIEYRGRVRCFEGDSDVLLAGSPVSDLLVPLDASLLLVGAGPTEPADVRRLEVVAFRQLLDGQPCPYAVRTTKRSFILTVPRESFLQALRQSEGLEQFLLLRSESAALRRLEDALVARGQKRTDIIALFSKLHRQPLHMETGALLPNRPSIWFVESGELMASELTAKRRSTAIRAFNCLGAEQLARAAEVRFRISATQPSVLYELPLEPARDLLASLQALELLLDDSPLREDQLVAGAAMLPPACQPLPGRIAEPAELWRRGIRTDTDTLVRDSSSDLAASIASVANILQLHGVSASSTSLTACFAGVQPLSQLRVAEVLEPFGLIARATRCTLATLSRHPLPALATLRGRLCVLLWTGRSALVHDPTAGLLAMTRAELAACWDGTLLEVTPADVESDRSNPDPSLAGATKRGILQILNERRSLAFNTALISLLTISLAVAQPLLAQVVLDNALTFRDLRVLVACSIGILLSYVLLSGLRWMQQTVFAELNAGFDARFGELFYRRVLALPTRFFAQHKTGDVLTRLRELEDIRSFLSLDALQLVVSCASMIIVAIVLCLYSLPIAGLALGLGLATVACQLALGGPLHRRFRASAHEATRATSLITEQVAAMLTVKACGAERALRERWEKTHLKARQLSLGAELLGSGSTTGLQILGAVARVGGLWLAARAALAGNTSPGQILAITAYLNQVVDKTADIGGFFGQLWQARAAFDNVQRILDSSPEESPEAARTTVSLKLTGKIKLDRIGFRYDQSPGWALQDIDLTIYPEQIVALVGRSGCGKTTLAHLIAGNLRPSEGHIYYDGVERDFIAQSSLRRQMGFVTQGRELFQGTIGENIAFAEDVPVDARITRAARDAQASQFITPLHAGFESTLGENGAGLSSGQTQRLSIARALYRDPSICIFDEATSQLDAESERAIVDNMRRILKGRTSIVIAHRLSTIRQADVIFVMREGRVVERGTHASLLAQHGHYSELFSNQDVMLDA